MAAAMLGVVVTGSTAEAALCAGAVPGTYLSNVCWLFEEHVDKTTVVSANEADCTVYAVHKYRDELRLQGEPGGIIVNYRTVHFNRANLSLSKIDRHTVFRGMWCLELRGEDIGGPDKDYFVFCGERPKKNLKAAADNLYTKYCSGIRSEF